MDELRCSRCGRQNVQAVPSMYDQTTREIKPLPPFGQRLRRGALLLVVACLALVGLAEVSKNEALSLAGSALIFAIVCTFAWQTLASERMPRVLACQCNVCGYRWFEKP